MSAKFLATILKLENKPKSGSDQPCCICLQDFGTLSSETGVIECGVALPCCIASVGSSCIATWCRTNNTCPVCRHVFFPAQPRPYLEHGIMTDLDPDFSSDPPQTGIDYFVMEDVDPCRPERVWHDICNALGLSDRIVAFAWQLTYRLNNMESFQRDPLDCLGGVAIYIMSHILGEPRSLQVVSAAVRTNPDHLESVYRALHPIRDQLVSVQLFMEPAARRNMHGPMAMLFGDGAAMSNMLALLPPPTEGDDIFKNTSEAVAISEREYDRIASREHLNEATDQYCALLGYRRGLLAGFVRHLSQNIAHKIRETIFLDSRSLRPVIAVSIYMASHLLRENLSIKQIAEALGISERTTRTAYRRVYPRRAEFVDDRFYHRMSISKVLRSLSWPHLAPLLDDE
ncbi:hypothetical protein BDR22DRAFT_889067 [Usnea florida]